MQLNKAEKAWKPSVKKSTSDHGDEEAEDDPEQVKSQQLLKRLRSILNKLTPEKFQELTKQVKELTIDTEERLKAAIDLIFEKAIFEPNFCAAYANMCRCLKGVSSSAFKSRTSVHSDDDLFILALHHQYTRLHIFDFNISLFSSLS